MGDAYIWHFSDKFRVFEPVNENQLELISSNYQADTTFLIEGLELKNASDNGKNKIVGDFPGTVSFSHLVSEKAVEKLGKFFEKSGVLHEVVIVDKDVSEKYFLYKCTNAQDCLDLSRSQLKYSPLNPSELVHIVTPVFKLDKVPEDEFFVLPQLLNGHIYIGEGIKKECKKHKLKGLILMDRMFGGETWTS